MSVVAPKITPPVAPVLFAPGAMVSVCAPMPSVPSVCATPAPPARRSLVICAFAVTIVLRLKASAVSLASWSSPPASVSVPAPSAPALLCARRIPAVSTMPPVNVFAPRSGETSNFSSGEGGAEHCTVSLTTFARLGKS